MDLFEFMRAQKRAGGGSGGVSADEAINKLVESGQIGKITETKETFILPEMSANMDNSYSNYINLNPAFSLVEGETYIVKFDGVEHECSCIKRGEQLGAQIIDYCLGDHRPTTDSDYYLSPTSNPPFGVVTMSVNGTEHTRMFIPNDGKTHTISVYQRTENVKPIDPKFLPAMDCLLLNGADGNLYEVTIDENGALAVAVKVDDTGGDVANTFTFTIWGVEMRAEEGMTWADWCDSEYNSFTHPSLGDGLKFELEKYYDDIYYVRLSDISACIYYGDNDAWYERSFNYIVAGEAYTIRSLPG